MQRHIIRQQIIEVTTDDEAGAYQLQTELSRIYVERIVPLIERACSQISAPDELLRLDSLVLDVGSIPLAELESALVERVAALLPDALARSARQSTTQTETAAELLVYFAYTGVLPWWVNDPAPGLISRIMMQLVGKPDFATVLRTIAEADDALIRLVRHLDEDALAAIMVALAPLPHADFSRWTQKVRPSDHRHFWAKVLRLFMAEPTLAPAAVLQAALDQNVRDGSMSPAELTDARLALADAVFARSEQPATLSAASVTPFTGTSIDYRGMEQRLQAIWEQGIRHLAVVLSSFPADEHAYLEHVLADLHLDADLTAALTDAEFAALLGAVRDQIADETRPVHSAESVSSSHMESPALPRNRRVSPPSTVRPIDLRFSDGDAIYVENAGLVILWQFLVPFFANVDLLTERQFKDTAAQQRAVGLLHVLATGQSDFPEFLLPLNKVLCGLPIDAPFDFGAPLTTVENEACSELLHVVIERAPVLRDMSPDGLRGTFLLRPGALSGQEGSWLLRVERRAYDVVLDQFPWTWTWLRLPWMETPLRVEW